MAKGGPKEALWRSHADVDRPRYGSGKEVTPILATKIVSFYAFAEAEGCKQVPRTWQQPAEPSRVVGGGGGAGEGTPLKGGAKGSGSRMPDLRALRPEALAVSFHLFLEIGKWPWAQLA